MEAGWASSQSYGKQVIRTSRWLSRVNFRSPSKTWISTPVWLSEYVEKVCSFLHGIAAHTGTRQSACLSSLETDSVLLLSNLQLGACCMLHDRRSLQARRSVQACSTGACEGSSSSPLPAQKHPAAAQLMMTRMLMLMLTHDVRCCQWLIT